MLLIYVVCVVVNDNPCIVYIVLSNDLLFLNIFVALIEGVFLCEKHTRALSINVYSIVEIVLKETPICLV